MASQSIKRQRQKRRVDQDGDPEFQVAPMVDVLLVLMLFFMAITSTEVLKKDPNLHLPEADHAKPNKDSRHKSNQITINVTWTAQASANFTIAGIRYISSDEVETELENRYHRDPTSTVLIRADQNVEYSSISDIMTACASAGIGTVSFAALLNPGHTHPATSGAASP
jgi:biopolymer transport protein ExbD